MNLKNALFSSLAGTTGVLGIGYVAKTLNTAVDSHYSKQESKSQKMLDESNEPIEATVLEEACQSTTYTLKIQTKEGKILGINVTSTEDTKKETLDMLIGKGSVINFPRGNLRRHYDGLSALPEETYFYPETQIGSKRADRIKVLKP